MSDVNNNAKTFRWWNIALLGFATVWGLNNVINNFANQGLAVVTSWILIMILYFVPYTLMVGHQPFKKQVGELVLGSKLFPIIS